MDIIGLLSSDGFIIINKRVAQEFGLQAAAIIGELCSEHKYWEAQGKLKDGYFYSTQENIEANTTVGFSQQKRIMDKLEAANIISTKKEGCPAKKYYKINTEELTKLFDDSRIVKSSILQSSNQALKNNKQIEKENSSITINSNTTISDLSEYESHSYSPKEIRDDFLGSMPKKQKTKKQSLYSKCEDEIYCYTKHIDLQDILLQYLPIRLAIKDKPIYGVNQWKGLLSRLSDISGESDSDKKADKRIKIVKQSIERGWASFFELGDGKNKKQRDVFSEYGQVSCEKVEEDIVDEEF